MGKALRSCTPVHRGSDLLYHLAVLAGSDACPAAHTSLSFTKEVTSAPQLQIAAGYVESGSEHRLILHDAQPP